MRPNLPNRILLPIVGPALLFGLVASAAAPTEAGDSDFGAEEAAHLLRRAGFGGTPEQVRQLAALGRDAAVDYLVDYERVPIGDEPYPLEDSDVRPLERRLLQNLEDEERQEIAQMLRRLNDRHMQAVREWWIRRMVVTNRPLQEKMVLFWHGHFTSGYREVRSWRDLYVQNQLFRENALGRFRDLLVAISRDPAMLKYLDNARNVKTSPNENYARELMELFTLGEGKYDERDIKEAARAFTGWGVDVDGFRFYPRRHDFGTKTLFGSKGRFDGEDVIDVLLRHPSSSRWMARCLLEFFVVPDPLSEEIEELAAVLRESKFDFRESLRHLFKSDLFYSDRARFAQIKSPVDLVVGAVRALEMETVNPAGLWAQCRSMGQNLFQPPNVKGWDGDADWITTNTLFARYNFGVKLVGEGVRPRGRTLAGGLAEMRARMGAGAGATMMDDAMAMRPTLAQIGPNVVATAPYDPRPTMAAHRLESPDEIVRHYVARLVQRELEPERFAALVEAFSPEQRPFRPEARDAPERIRQLVSLILSLPEYQLG
jgi:hypothetical protein